MHDYVWTSKYEDSVSSVSLVFAIEQDKVLAIGEKMGQINKEAYMNGYNWEVFFDYYLYRYAPDVTVNMTADPEAGMYAAYYPLTPENEERAEKFVQIIRSLVENEEELYRIVREEGSEIKWD